MRQVWSLVDQSGTPAHSFLKERDGIFLSEVDMSEVPDVIKISDDGNHETFQITHERYLSSVQVPGREQDQAYIATESWITFDEQGIRTELAQAFGVSGPDIETLLDTARKQYDPRGQGQAGNVK
jgi:hypothetical protein